MRVCAAVCRPYEASNLGSVSNARIQVVLVTLFAVLFNLPRFFEYDVVAVYGSHGPHGALGPHEVHGPHWLLNNTLQHEGHIPSLDSSLNDSELYEWRAEKSWLLHNHAYQVRGFGTGTQGLALLSAD